LCDFCTLSRSTGSSSGGYGLFLPVPRLADCICRIARNALRQFAMPRLEPEALTVGGIEQFAIQLVQSCLDENSQLLHLLLCQVGG
jgi:hypothetical protein